MMKDLLIIGHSHVDALYEASLKENSAFESVSLINLRECEYETSKNKNQSLVSNVRYKISSLLYEKESLDSFMVVVIMRGNFHNVFGMIESDIPYDFYMLHEEIETSITQSIIPFRMIEELFLRDFGIKKWIFDLLESLGISNYAHLGFPPPLYSNSLIHSQLSLIYKNFTEDQLANASVSSPHFRYKLWKTYTNVAKFLCEKWGVRFIDVPDGVFEDQKYLKSDLIGHDPTHANAVYGQEYLHKISSLFEEQSTDAPSL